jgi:hypothetical protein
MSRESQRALPRTQVFALEERSWRRDTLPVGAVAIIREILPRAISLDRTTVSGLRASMHRAETVPAIKVAAVHDRMILVDGRQRLEAAASLSAATIEADVADMSMDEAVIEALRANATRGLPLTNADKRRTVDIYVSHGFHLGADGAVKSLRAIEADLHHAVSYGTVRTVFRKLDIIPDRRQDSITPLRLYRGPREEKAMLHKASTLIRSVRIIGDRLAPADGLATLRSDVAGLLNHIDAELSGLGEEAYRKIFSDI